MKEEKTTIKCQFSLQSPSTEFIIRCLPIHIPKNLEQSVNLAMSRKKFARAECKKRAKRAKWIKCFANYICITVTQIQFT